MKIIKLLIVLIGFAQSLAAQDFSSFYQVIEGTAMAKHNDETGYELAPKDDLVFKPLTESTLDIRFEIMANKKEVENTTVFIRVGNEQQVEFGISFTNGVTTRVNGDMVEKYGYVTNQMEEENSKSPVLHFVLRITKDMVKPFSYGEMGSNNITDEYETDSPNIHIRTTSGTVAVKLAIETAFMPTLNVFAKSGLKMRQAADLNSSTLTTIPYGAMVFVMDSLDARLPLYDFSMVDTKGDLQVGELSSKMIKVLYGDKIGYVYGGYLLPFHKLKAENYANESNFNGWAGSPWDNLAEEVFYQNILQLKKGDLNFEYYPYESIDVTQRKFLLVEFFPNLEMDKINAVLKENKTHILKIKEGNYEETFEITVANNQIQQVLYTKILNGLMEKILGHKTGYVVADNLNMRQSGDATSEVITTIPFGASVSIVANSAAFSVIGGVHGKMVKIKYNGKEGYVFDAYLSPTEPLSLSKEKNPILAFDAIVKEKSNREWKYNGNGWYGSEWLVIPSRDKFQALKTLRKLCPELNDLSLEWNESTQDYDITSTSERITIYEGEDRNQWIINIINTKDENDTGTSIIIESIMENMQRVTIFKEEIGC